MVSVQCDTQCGIYMNYEQTLYLNTFSFIYFVFKMCSWSGRQTSFSFVGCLCVSAWDVHRGR